MCSKLFLAVHQPVAEAATYTTHNNHKRQMSMSTDRFDPATPAIERPQTYAIYNTAIGIGDHKIIATFNFKLLNV
jgi:hypothetical protein